MANQSHVGGKQGRLLQARPLRAQPIPSESDTPPAPIPVETSSSVAPLSVEPVPLEAPPSEAVPPAPIPVDTTPPAPIPMEAAPEQTAPPATIRIDPPEPAIEEEAKPAQPSTEGAAPQRVPVPAAEEATSSNGAKPSTSAKPQPILVKKQKTDGTVSGTGWRRGRKAVGVREELQEIEEEGTLAVFWRDLVANNQGMAVSAAVHVAIIIVLGLLTLSMPSRNIQLIASADLPEELEFDDLEIDQAEFEQEATDIVDRLEPDRLEPMVDMEPAAEGIDAASVELSSVGLERAPFNDLLSEVGRGTGRADARGTGKGKSGNGLGSGGSGKGMGGRGGRRGKAIDHGATMESENAVNLALKWLAAHQLPDGGWSFEHRVAPSCLNKCRNPGSMPEARIAATALGVLPFLGAGHTHQVGKYQKTVAGGLNYLITHMQIKPEGGSLFEEGGRMYSHGLATIALCEAYAMSLTPEQLRRKATAYDGTGERSPSETLRAKQKINKSKGQIRLQIAALGRAAQLALNFVVYAQDPNGGGWRYQPRQAGDTSVVGWQLMALMSGRMGYLIVDPRSFDLATKYLDAVQIESGSDYGYTEPERGSSATQAIGLLSRMYLGWKREHPALEQGVRAMNRKGPSRGNMYFNYYATQVIHHFGGEPWKQWNPRMRDSLVNSQAKVGHEEGSWYFGGADHGSDKGGRLYCTALSAMTLEVYYRHMPLYGGDIFDEDKPAKKKEAPKKPKDVDDF